MFRIHKKCQNGTFKLNASIHVSSIVVLQFYVYAINSLLCSVHYYVLGIRISFLLVKTLKPSNDRIRITPQTPISISYTATGIQTKKLYSKSALTN